MQTAQFFWRLSTTPRLMSRRPNRFTESERSARILQSQKQENGQIKVVVEGRERATTVRVENTDGAFMALVRRAPVVNEEGARTRRARAKGRATG